MPIAVTEEHRRLGEVASSFATERACLEAARALLEGESARLPSFWAEMADLGWFGLHLPESFGGSGFGLSELVVVVEELAARLAPGPFVPTVAASAVILAAGSPEQASRWLPSLADGSRSAAVGLGGGLELGDEGLSKGDGGVVLGGALADVLVLRRGDDMVVVEAGAPGVSPSVGKDLDPSRPSARVELSCAESRDEDVLAGAAPAARALYRTLLAAEATGIARACTESATSYAKSRRQFGRPIAMFQAVKHHCANMLVAAEVAAATTWDAARAASAGGEEFELAAAAAASLALPAALTDAHLCIQVHGGIGFTWEHDAHLYLRRALSLSALCSPEAAACDVAALRRAGVQRRASLDLPTEAEELRPSIRADAEEIAALDAGAQRERLIESGYLVAHWPKPWGREASALEQLVIDEQFAAAGLRRPQLGITAWVILTIIQHGTADQVRRWVRPTLAGEVVWCQLFSEPDAGSDAAGVTTRATRVEGGFLLNGQKVWTSGAQIAAMGLATVRTDPAAEKHAGITTVAVDMAAPGVEVRPLKQVTGASDFNEVFFSDVFVPDDDVVGAPNAGWTVARATLGNERVSIGGGVGNLDFGVDALALYDAHPERLAGGAGRLGRYLARAQALGLLNLRRAERAISGAEPGPEGNVTKLLLAEQMLELGFIGGELSGEDLTFLDGPSALSGLLGLASRALSIAGGTSEITRNQIGERILGLPRDPLLS
ncbi:MAG: acyl-CoA dehydrogenase [Acidimicrobiales bacterium]